MPPNTTIFPCKMRKKLNFQKVKIIREGFKKVNIKLLGFIEGSAPSNSTYITLNYDHPNVALPQSYPFLYIYNLTRFCI